VKHIKFYGSLFTITITLLISTFIFVSNAAAQEQRFIDDCEAFNLSSKCIPPKKTIAPKPKPIPLRSNFIKDEVILLYSSNDQKSVIDVTKKYRLKPKSKVTLSSVKLGMILADTNGKSPLELVKNISRQEKKVVASTNNTFSPAALDVSKESSSNAYAMIETGVLTAHKTTKGSGTLICMVDTPVDIFHPSLAHAMIETLDLIDFNPKNLDTQIHGTSVAGLLVSQNKHIGIAPKAKLFAISAFTTTKKRPYLLQGTSADVAKALDRCITQKSDVINLSFTGGKDDLVERMVNKAIANGITVVAAGGNGGHWGSTVYPALIPGVIAATAVDQFKHLYPMANKGRFIDFSAPGVNVLTIAPGGKYNIASGTSLSTAHVSGIVALLLSKQKRLHQQGKVENILTKTAIDLGKPGRDQEFGEGLVNVSRALSFLTVVKGLK
jgi:subtilisin family serine protease